MLNRKRNLVFHQAPKRQVRFKQLIFVLQIKKKEYKMLKNNYKIKKLKNKCKILLRLFFYEFEGR